MRRHFMSCPHCSVSNYYDACNNRDCENGRDNIIADTRENAIDLLIEIADSHKTCCSPGHECTSETCRLKKIVRDLRELKNL